MSKNNSKHEIEYKICDLTQRAELFIEWAKEIRLFYQKCKKNKIKTIDNHLLRYLVIQHNLYFFDAILTMHTLLQSNMIIKRNKELTLESLLHRDKNKLENDIEILRDKYKKSKLDNVRDKIIAHKDIKNVGDPVTHFMNLISDHFFNNAVSILDDIKKFLNQNSFCLYGNNFYLILFSQGNKAVAEIIKNKIEENYGSKIE